MAKRTTMQTVAEMAGVSRGTVDRVLKQRPHVSPDVHERVLRALKDSGYLAQQQAKQNQRADVLKPLRLGVLMPVWVGQLRQEFMHGIEDAQRLLAEYSTEIIVRQCANDEPEEALHQLQLLIEEGIDGLSICVVNDPLIVRELNRLCDTGLPVITYNSDLPDSGRLRFVGQDPYRSGRIAGEIMHKLARDDQRILISCGNLEFYAHRIRVQGFKDRITERGVSPDRLTVIETYNDYAITRRKFLEAFAEDRDVAVYMANRSVTGCVSAMTEAGILNHLPLVCHDYSEPVRDLLQQGVVDFSIAQDLRMQGYLPLVLLRNRLHKITASLYHETQIIHILCAENIEAFLNT